MKLIPALACVALVLANLSLSGCSTPPTRPPAATPMTAPAAGSGRIVFYRPGGLFGYAMRPEIVVDGIKRGTSAPGTLFNIDLPAGVHRISVENSIYPGERALQVTVDSSRTIYVRTSLGGSAFAGRTNVELIDDTRAAQETAGLEIVAALN